MPTIEIGNTQPIEGFREGGVLRYRPYAGGDTSTIYNMPDDWSLEECLLAFRNSIGVHMAEGAKPSWVECSAPGLRALILEDLQLPKDTGGRPEGWPDPDHPVATEDGPVPKKAAKVRKAAKKKAVESVDFMMLHLAVLYAFMLVMATRLQLRTNAGRDWQARIMGDSASTATGTYASGSYMGVSSDTGAPNAANNVLPGEITTGTLARKQAAYSHTVGTSSYALTAVFVFDQDITLAKLGIFNAATGGTFAFESLLNAVVVGKPGDQTTITETITL